jgi:hypothetical protein
MLLLPPMLTLSVILERFLQVQFQPVELTDRIEPAPGLTEREAEFFIVRDRAREIVNQELWREGCHPRIRLDGSHACPCSVM